MRRERWIYKPGVIVAETSYQQRSSQPTMCHFQAFFLVAVTVLIPYAATLEEEERVRLETVKQKCIQGIYQTFRDVRDEYETFHFDDEKNYFSGLKKILLDGLEDVRSLVKELDEHKKSIDTVQTTPNFYGRSIHCDANVTDKLSEIVNRIRERSGLTIKGLKTP
ncbi:uncharacterized protein [Venturia canescens]|uniref:uncharacterized protein n=1 Tax=Venturia canescens TaxID=32260 RepID=UPI001C9C8F8A|nr:uncharacterized protein LOC122408059 [Venturia canescens]XP_043270539.1 uncharacterized protein LOC122408059 [Venturia canescens]